MRIHHLAIEAIGPFPGRHEVDIDELSAGGLFLLEGPTGSGKSTLIDAITFGLFGSLGSPERDDRLPSAHAPGREPVIEVVFSTGAGLFRVRRTPAYERPKLRGQGTTRQNATAKLWRLATAADDAGEPIAASAQEVGTELQSIIGLTREQFSQTVVLPQGRFATFLRAKPAERAAVLQDVFGTSLYQQLEDQLAALARTTKRELESARQEVRTAVRSLCDLLDEDDPAVAQLAEAEAELDTAALAELATGVATRAGAAAEQATAAAAEAERLERAAQQRLDAERDLAQRLRTRTELLAEEAQLRELAPHVEEQRTRLAAARRAATVAGALREYERAEQQAADTRAEVERVCAALAEGPDADLTELTEVGQLRSVVEQLVGERSGLAPQRDVEAGLPERRTKLTEDEADAATRRTALGERESVLAQRPERRTRLVEALDHIRREALPIAEAKTLLAGRMRVLEAAQRAAELGGLLTAAQAGVTAAADAAQEAAATEHRLRTAWIAGMAGELADKLVPGEPCAVCGGTEHPAPARRAEDHVAAEDVEDAQARREQAEQQLAKALEERGRLEAQMQAAEQESGGLGLAQAKEAVSEAEQELAGAEEAVRLAELREAELAAFQAETDQLRDEIAREAQALAVLTEQLRGREEQLAADELACRTAAGDCASVAERLALVEARLAAGQQLITAHEARYAAERQLTNATSARTEALTEADFPDPAAAVEAALTPEALEQLAAEVSAHEVAIGRVRAGLAVEPIAALTGTEEADPAAAKEVHERQRVALAEASAAAGRASDLAERLDRARDVLDTVLSAHAATTEAAAPVLRMGELATGGEGNARSTTLSTYVLLRRFEDVVAAANDRLAVMSDGRYALMRIDGREGRSRKAGLGLRVRDHLTETSRDPHTLSGGETFYVSLCLALGLADVVTSEAGGIALDTLFVDEGFGSLDPHTLDGVLGELDRLQAGGRAVGIVSHVSELKDRIADRIEISRTPAGGSTLKVRAGT